MKKYFLDNFAKFTGKNLYQSLFFNKIAGINLQLCLKKRIWQGRFYSEFCEILNNNFLIEHLWTTAYDLSLQLY